MSTPTTVILAHLRAVGGPVAATPLLEHVGWAMPPSNVPKAEALTPIQKLRNLMADLAYLDQVQEVRRDCWQALDRWGKPIERVRTVSIKACGIAPPDPLLDGVVLPPRESPDVVARREAAMAAREAKAAQRERSSRRPRGVQLDPEDRERRKLGFLASLRSGMTILASARSVGVGESAARAWMDKDPGFRTEAKAILAAEPRKTGKGSSLTRNAAATIRKCLFAGDGPTEIARLLDVPLSRCRGWIEQVRRADRKVA